MRKHIGLVCFLMALALVGCTKKVAGQTKIADSSDKKLLTNASEVWSSTDSEDLILWGYLSLGGYGAGPNGSEYIWLYEGGTGTVYYSKRGDYPDEGKYNFSYKLNNDGTIGIDFLDDDGNTMYISNTFSYEITEENNLVLYGTLNHPGRGDIIVRTKYHRQPWYN
ncbi:hypothetical protein FACS189442_0310 [Spirochaetia bacterium]|nr:hypothetical protein FACS189442_0310 [Spirochaetia bacterium]